jgi:hypothetical protein
VRAVDPLGVRRLEFGPDELKALQESGFPTARRKVTGGVLSEFLGEKPLES